jgi:subfamily B ATP-binding cassette protein MsbA
MALLVYTLFSALSLAAVIPFLEILFSSQEPPQAPSAAFSLQTAKEWGYYALGEAIAHQGKAQVLLQFCLALCFSILVKNAARYLSSYWLSPIEQGILYALRKRIFGHLAQQDLGFFTHRRKGDLMSLVISDVQVVQESVSGTLLTLLREPATLLTFLGALFLISWELTLLTLLALPLSGWAVGRIAGPLKRAARKGQEALGQLSARFDEFAGSIRVVKAFQAEAFEAARYDAENRRYFQLQVALSRRSELASPITEVISVGIVCAIIYYGSLLILSGQGGLKASEFLGFVALFSQVLAPLKALTGAFSKVQRGTAAFGRIEELLAQQPSVRPPAQAIAVDGFREALRFEGVSFRYAEAEVLKEISFVLPKGKTLALVGPSGGGKSTLADLIPRFYDPSAGRILLDGADLRSLDLAGLRRQIGIVSQEGILFHDTVFSNIAYGLPSCPPEAVLAAARMAHAHAFIEALPQGYDTLIGERGLMLSGGQRQRLSIARALLRNPEILILDEATSNLDTESERLIQQALEELLRDRTALIIAHRLSTIQHADEILFIEAGRIVERGSHAELLRAGGRYRQLYESGAL